MKRVFITLMSMLVVLFGFAKARPGAMRAFYPYCVTVGASNGVSDFSQLYGLVGISWFTQNAIEVQAIVGYPLHYSLGMNFHPNTSFGSGRISPYAGIAAGQFKKAVNANVPIGLTYVAPAGFTLGMGLRNYFFFKSTNETLSPFESFLELNVGWSF
jgi:hypothetical protein